MHDTRAFSCLVNTTNQLSLAFDRSNIEPTKHVVFPLVLAFAFAFVEVKITQFKWLHYEIDSHTFIATTSNLIQTQTVETKQLVSRSSPIFAIPNHEDLSSNDIPWPMIPKWSS